MTNEVLIHYSRQPLLEVKSVPVAEQPEHFKPRGLWVSVEGTDDWKSWCEKEDFFLENLTHAHKIIPTEEANILRLSKASELDMFTRDYSPALGYGQRVLEQSTKRLGSRYQIDWKLLASRYDGIIIAPYIWKKRLDPHTAWYYSWDCASGCIWNANAVKEIVPLATATPDEEAQRAATPGPREIEKVDE